MRVLRLFSCVFLYFVLTNIFVMPVSASGPEATDNTAQLKFPDSVTFHLSVQSDNVIDSIELEYGTTQVTCGPASAKAKPDFEPATEVTVNWVWDFRKSGAPPPGTQLWWRWNLKDETGQEVIIPKQELFINDADHDWQETRSDELILFSAIPNEAFNQNLWQAATEALNKLENDIGAPPERPIKIYNYPDTEDLRESRLYAQEWTGGLALPAYDTILLGTNPGNQEWGERTVAHELTHLIVHQVTFNCLGDIPTWLDEGLATYIEGDLENYQQEAFDKAVTDDQLLSLRSLSSSFPTNSQRAHLAYAQSHQVVEYLIETHGADKMGELLETFKAGNSYDKALQQVYGLDTQQLDNEWRISLGLQPREIVATPTSAAVPTLAPFGANSPTPTSTSPSPTSTVTPRIQETATPIAVAITPSPIAKQPISAVSSSPPETKSSYVIWVVITIIVGIIALAVIGVLITKRLR